MTKNELKVFRKALESTLADLQAGDESREGLAIESSSDELDRIQHASNRDYAIGKLERDLSRMREVRAALYRMENGAYGICAGCDQSINAKRLAAVPWANTCIACQQSAETVQETVLTEAGADLFTTA